jgi:hypothetical protein
VRLVQSAASALHLLPGEECNKYDLTAAPCFLLADHNDSSRWFAISSTSDLFAIIMIRPGGLLLVVLPTFLQSLFQFFGWGY